jgi:hypothetical protein
LNIQQKSISAAQVVQPGLRLLRGLESFETGPTPLELAGLIYPTDNMQIWSGAPAFFRPRARLPATYSAAEHPFQLAAV